MPPPPPFGWSPSPALRAGADKRIGSRDRSCPSLADHHAIPRFAPKRERSAERRIQTMSALTRGCALRRARLSALTLAALATGYHPDGSAPEPGFLKARRQGVLPVRRMGKHAPCGPVFLPVDRGPRAARGRIAFIRARAPLPAPSYESALAKGALFEQGKLL